MITEIVKNVVTGKITTRQIQETDISIEQIRSEKLRELPEIVNAVRSVGMAFQFNNSDYHIQTGLHDINNWTSALTRLYRMTDTSATHWVRTQENVTIHPTVSECILLMEQAQDYHYALLIANGTVKDAIKAMTIKTDLSSLDVQATFSTALQAILNP